MSNDNDKADGERIFKTLMQIAESTKSFLISLPVEMLCEAIYENVKKNLADKDLCIVIKENRVAIIKDPGIFEKMEEVEQNLSRH